MRITSKGQVTIPQAVREEAGLLPGTEVAFVVEGDAIRLIKTQGSKRPSRGERTVARLRRSAGNVSLTTDELMAFTRGDG